MSKANFDDYEFLIRRLSTEDGGGFLITFPDLPGCMSDGESPDQALKNGRDAFDAWISTCIAEDRAIPAPGSHRNESVRFVQRLPRYMHSSLVTAAEAQGVSVNALVMTFVAEGLTKIEMTNAAPNEKVAAAEGHDTRKNVTHVVVDAKPVVDIEPKTKGANTTSSGAETQPHVFYVKGTEPADRSRYS